VVHEPSGLLRDLETSVKFVGTDTVLATDKQPRSAKPFFKSDRRVLKDRARLKGERWLRMSRVTFPDALLHKPCDPLRSALRTFYCAIRPAKFHHELAAMLKIREPDYRVSQGVWAFYKTSMQQDSRNVKYVIAQTILLIF
jgi:hypothetical protein